MTGHIHLQKSRARFLEEARKELAAFERREREFRKMERKERALYLWRTLLTAHLTSDTPTPEMLLRTLSLCPGLAFRSRATCDGHPRKNGWPSFFIGAKGEL